MLLNYLLNPWSRVLLEKLTGLQLVKKFPAFCGTRRFTMLHYAISPYTCLQNCYLHVCNSTVALILVFCKCGTTLLFLRLPLSTSAVFKLCYIYIYIYIYMLSFILTQNALTLLGSPPGNLWSRSLLDSLRGSLVLATYTGTLRPDAVFSITASPFSILEKIRHDMYLYI
jgi:hypothetical protein